MDSSNSKNVSYIILLLVVATSIFAYVLLSNNVDGTIQTNIKSGITREE